MEKQHSLINLYKERRNLIVGLIVAIVAVNAFVAYVTDFEDSIVYYDLIRGAIVGIATVLALIVFAKQGYSGLFGRAYTALAVGLIFYLAAEVSWSYYELVLQEESPFPSIADVFYLLGYAGFGYFQFSLFKFYGKGVRRLTFFVVIPSVAVLAFLYFQSLMPYYDLSSQDAFLPVALTVTYPILDSIIFVPAILMILNSGKGQLTSIPWLFVSWILSGSADILFGYMSVTQYEAIAPIVTMTYNAAYLCMAAGLLWYLRVYLSEGKRLLQF